MRRAMFESRHIEKLAKPVEPLRWAGVFGTLATPEEVPATTVRRVPQLLNDPVRNYGPDFFVGLESPGQDLVAAQVRLL